MNALKTFISESFIKKKKNLTIFLIFYKNYIIFFKNKLLTIMLGTPNP